MKQSFARSFLLLSILTFSGCSEPPVPPEVKLAEAQEQSLWRAGASDSSPASYQGYLRELRQAKDHFIEERGRFVWWRDYRKVQLEYKTLLARGDRMLAEIRAEKLKKASEVTASFAHCEKKLRALEKLSSIMNEGRLARRNLTKAGVALDEAETLRRKEKYDEAKSRLFDAGVCLRSAEAALKPIISRYADRTQVAKWRKWVEDTVAESRERGITAIVVSKVDRSLTVYRNGAAYRSYDVGLGRNGFNAKLYSGDHATPEGRYRIVKKINSSKYYKALLIDYPNDEDKRQFLLAKRRGLVPPKAGIGGLLEIHGGGDDGMTYGCIALDDRFMDEVFRIVDVGTPVTIVGSKDLNNLIADSADAL